MPKTDKQKAAEKAIKMLDDKFGKKTVVRLGDAPLPNVEVIPSGHKGIDEAIGVGGLPRGRLLEYFGPEMQGKTTLGLLSVAATQKEGGRCAFIDAEFSLDLKWAESLGVDVKNLDISQPEYGEEALEIVETLVDSGAYDLIVVDSVAALVPKEEWEGSLSDKDRLGAQARMLNTKLRRLVGHIGRSRCVVIFINQVREKIGVMFGNPETTPGGRALKFYASVRLRVGKVANSNIKKTIDGKPRIVGHKVKIEVKKNKVAPPFGGSEFELIYANPDVLDVKEEKEEE